MSDETKASHGDVSRRTFIKGTAALAGAAAASQVLTACDAEAARAVGGDPALAASLAVPRSTLDVGLTVNGQELSLTVEARTTLAEALRDELGLTGTKVGCDRAACGACTVIVDGRATYSCSMLAVEADGLAIQTVEGLASGGDLHPIQAAFVRNDALQCGFCTPGMVMACKALLDQDALPSDQAIKDGLAGNLCRCGTYPRVFTACREASEEML